MSEWIKCSPESMPKEGEWVLVYHSGIVDKKVYESGIFYDGDTYCYCPVGQVGNVTKWMPLPKPPKDDE